MSAKIYGIADGVEGLFVKNERFNTTSVSFNFYLPLKKETAAEYALLPFVLTTCGKEYPDFSVLNYRLERLYGAQLDAVAEKVGDYQLLKLRISVINDKYTFESDSLTVNACKMLLSLIFEPKAENGAFAAQDLAREKRKAAEHVKGELSEKRIYAKNRLIEEMYGGESYGVPKCGTPEDIEAITADGLYAAWEKMLSSAFVRVQVIGATVPQGLFDEIGRRFESIERFDITDCTKSLPTAVAEHTRSVTERQEIRQGKLVMGFTSDMAGDDEHTLPLMVMTDIFGGGPYSRLFTNVREKMSLCYYCAASSVRCKGLLTVESGVEEENAEKAENAINQQLEAMKNGEFTEFELSSSLKSIKDSLCSYNDSQPLLDVWYGIKAVNGRLYSPDELAEAVGGITREEIISAARGIKPHTVYRLLPKGETE